MLDEFTISIPARDVPVTIHWKVGDSYTDKTTGTLYTKTEDGWLTSFDPDYIDCANDGCWEGGNMSDTKVVLLHFKANLVDSKEPIRKIFRKDKGIVGKDGDLYCCECCKECMEEE